MREICASLEHSSFNTRPTMSQPGGSTRRSALPVAFVSIVLLLACNRHAVAQLDRLEVEGYAIINYAKYAWQTDPQRRASIDLERAAIEPTYRLSDRIELEAEIEFEHGGTGSAMEFDKFEEFGEYEQEVDKGGEVVLEKLAVTIAFEPWLNLRLGHFYLPIGLTNSDYEPTDYFTVTRSEAESGIIPATWHETGIELFGVAGAFSYRAQIVNGLDATGFSSAAWVSGGHQGRFETINAENLAIAARVDYKPFEELSVGISGYHGNSADNRPKPDLTVPANVSIGEAHGVFRSGGLTARGEFLYGALQNSGAVSKANRNLSNNLNVKRTPVGSAAMGWYAEAGYDLMPLLDSASTPVELFGRYEFYDSMYKVDPEIFDNPRWQRSVATVGVNYKPIPALVIKAAYSRRILGTPSDNREETFGLGMGVEF